MSFEKIVKTVILKSFAVFPADEKQSERLAGLKNMRFVAYVLYTDVTKKRLKQRALTGKKVNATINRKLAWLGKNDFEH